MTSSEIRQSFLDFFRDKKHTIVPSASLLPDSPNLLFTNAGMNQFVPIFLGQQKAAWDPPRVADTQKCIRAGGKHNDLDDVGLDTYHHTFFEMLGNWSFGDYFKKDAIEWAWELVVERWKFPANRVYATVYCPFMGREGWKKKWQAEIGYAEEVVRKGAKVYGPDRAPYADDEGIESADQLAAQYWVERFLSVNLDPQVHVVPGSTNDNFWMMGDTGPCGPCSELHIDLTPKGDTKGSLVNAGDSRCIEIWNLVFIQFNANADGTFSPLPQSHVDTGMGFERVTAMIQGTKDLSDFSRPISNYETDIFRPIFDDLEQLSGNRYRSTLPVEAPAQLEDFLNIPKNVLGDSLDQLDDRERKVLFMRLGLDGKPPQTLSSIGRKFGASRERIAKIVEDVREKVWASYEVQQKSDIAFRVIADHIRTLSFAIADGIQPSNEGRGYVLRRVLRRAARYGRTLGFHEPFLYKLVDVLVKTLGNVFPELRERQQLVRDTIRREEEAFNRTLDKGLEIFEGWVDALVAIRAFLSSVPKTREKLKKFILHSAQSAFRSEELRREFWELVFGVIKMPTDFDTDRVISRSGEGATNRRLQAFRTAISDWQADRNTVTWGLYEVSNDWASADYDNNFFVQKVHRMLDGLARVEVEQKPALRATRVFPAATAFRLYDEQGFPLDLTELMARERGLTVDTEGFENLMDEQRARARAAQKKEAVEIDDQYLGVTKFVGYDFLEADTRLLGTIMSAGRKQFAILETSPFYPEMGGQVGDCGEIRMEDGRTLVVRNTTKHGATFRHEIDPVPPVWVTGDGDPVRVLVDIPRRRATERHHTVTHILHWALHEIVSREATQKGSYVGPDKLTFDFSSAALTAQQKREVEKLVNERIEENASVSWTEIPYVEAKKRSDIQQVFGDKYGELVRVVQIGGESERLNGYSMELCGGTHVRATGDIGSFRIVREEAIAAGIRRIEAVAGDAARDWAKTEAAKQQEKFETLARKKDGIAALPAFADSAETKAMLEQVDARAAHLEKLGAEVLEWEKQLAKASDADLRSRAGTIATELAAAHAGEKSCVAEIPNADAKLLQAVADLLKQKIGGPIFLAGATEGRVALIAAVPKEFTSNFQANKLIQEVAPIVGGKGGGRPENAQGAGKDATKIGEALARARELLAQGAAV